MPDLNRRVAAAVAWNTVFIPIGTVLTLASTVAIARYLPISAFAVYSVALAVKNSVLLLGDLGLSGGATKFFPELIAKEGRRGGRVLLTTTLVYRGIIAGVLIAFLIVLSAPLRQILKISEPMGFVLWFAGIIAAVESFGLAFQSFLTATFRVRALNMIGIGHTIAQALLLIGSVLAGFGVYGIMAALVLGSSLRLVAAGFLVGTAIPRLPEVPSSSEISWMPRFHRVSLSVYFEKLASYFHSPTFVILILAALGKQREVALFALASELVLRSLGMTLSPANNILLPAFAEAFLRNDESRRRVFTYSIRFLSLLAIPALAILLNILKDIIPLFYSSKFLDAVVVAQILACFYFLEYTVYSPANASLLAGEGLRSYFFVKAASLFLVPIYALAAQAGILATAATMGAVRLLVATTLLAACLWNFRELTFPKQVSKIYLSGFLVMLIIWWVQGLSTLPSVLRIVQAVLIGAAGTWWLLRVTGAFQEEDRKLVSSLDLPWARLVGRFM